MKVEYKGWKRYVDSGRPYRWWTFLETVEELGAKAKDELHDHGPGAKEQCRFVLRRGDRKLRFFSLAQVEEGLGHPVGWSWHPPREDQAALLESLGKLTKAVEDLSWTVRSRMDAEKEPDQIRELVEPKNPKAQGKQNVYLRVKGEHRYDNGDPYQDFELLVDVPEIPVTRVDGLDPMHAAAGDVLRETYEDGLTPFELRRNGRRIGDPEWWQVRHLFAGLKEHDEVKLPSSYMDPHLRRLYRLAPGTEKEASIVLRAPEAIPSTIVQPGDYLVYKGESRPLVSDVAGARIIPVPRVQLKILGKDLDALTVLDVKFNPDWTTPEKQLANFRRYLRRPQRPKWSDATSRVSVVRPLVAPVSEPIRASSDDVAIFELLMQVGGRMPSKEA